MSDEQQGPKVVSLSCGRSWEAPMRPTLAHDEQSRAMSERIRRLVWVNVVLTRPCRPVVHDRPDASTDIWKRCDMIGSRSGRRDVVGAEEFAWGVRERRGRCIQMSALMADFLGLHHHIRLIRSPMGRFPKIHHELTKGRAKALYSVHYSVHSA